ncbi:hypothetical protein COB21_04750 [Candidatus Aerophobetes bacterium]|uniref:signal peptidase I n=1 Tax=Aerophobetes bacterium TaxID=2030807 RepID=A0A2A4X232_UNCAE|nr:MAG: hypothetical protein COB21_04750 [Candidatus Aerophobetes bacterium]
MKKGFSLFKMKRMYFQYQIFYKKNKKRLSTDNTEEFLSKLDALKESLASKDLDQSNLLICEVDQLIQRIPSPGMFKQILSWCVYIFCTLLVVIVLRSMVVELMRIPSGSMRPTFREQDNLVTGKTSFGLNIPFYPGHFYFNEKLVQRAQIAVWTGKGMDIPHSNTNYFFLFPGKKQYVKRIMGKGGDTLYFYGGKIYGVDKQGRDISNQLQPSYLSSIDHVPYISFNGDEKEKRKGSTLTSSLYQMNQHVGSISYRSPYLLKGTLSPAFKKFDDLYNLWGFKNYGMSRILTEKEYLLLSDKTHGIAKSSDYYLEIFHHPTLKHPQLIQSIHGHMKPSVGIYRAYIPLSSKHLKSIAKKLYTARFVVKNGKIARYGNNYLFSKYPHMLPSIVGISNGTYEYYYGKAYKIYPLGIKKELSAEHKLMHLSSKEIQLFYNLGIDCNLFYCPKTPFDEFLPSRYVYFRNGNLITMNGCFLEKDDPALITFNQLEAEKASNSNSSHHPYIPFKDYGAPLNSEGKIDLDVILKYGFKVPDKATVMLGDNYAMSSDSRSFGPIPYTQLKGSPLFVFFPPSSAFKALPQPKLPLFGYLPMLVIIVLLCIGIVEFVFFIKKYISCGKTKR